MKFKWLLVLVLTLGWLASAVSLGMAGIEICREDAEKFCKNVKRGEGRIMACLTQNEPQLAPACKKLVREAQTQIESFSQACGQDMQSFCMDVKPGDGRMLRCLKRHETQLSPACVNFFK